MDDPCKTCGQAEFMVENHERVCTSCGDVVEELAGASRLCSAPDNATIEDSHRNKNYEANQRLTGRIRNETNSAQVRKKINQDKLLDDMRKVVKQFVKHPAAVDETMDLVDSTFKAYQGRLLTSKKLGLVGACIYYLSAKHQLGISLHDICKATNIKRKVMSASLKLVKHLCPTFEYERPNIKDLVKKYVDELATKHYDLNAADISGDANINDLQSRPLIDMKDRTVLQNRVMLLMDLFEAMHPYNQPSPHSLITAVVYHAWKSLDTFKMIAVNLSSSIQNITMAPMTVQSDLTKSDEDHHLADKALKVKHSIGYEKFCQICNLNYTSNGYKMVNKLQSSLLMLGKYLGDVNKINLPWFLKDIIENSADLLQEHMRTEPSLANSNNSIKSD